MGSGRYGNILLSERNQPFSRLFSWPIHSRNVWYGYAFCQQSINVYWLRTQQMVDDDTMAMRKRMSDAQRISSSSPPIILTHKEDLYFPIEIGLTERTLTIKAVQREINSLMLVLMAVVVHTSLESSCASSTRSMMDRSPLRRIARRTNRCVAGVSLSLNISVKNDGQAQLSPRHGYSNVDIILFSSFSSGTSNP